MQYERGVGLSSHLLIVGSGPGLSFATATRFGREGFRVSLLGRSRERLESTVSRLGSFGIEASAHVVDATDHEELTDVLNQIDSADPVDVCVFQPGGQQSELVDVLQAQVANVRPNLELLVLGAVATGQALVPRMMERGSGTMIFVGGGSARTPLRYFGNLGMAMAGLRAYAMTLHGALEGSGVHAAFLTLAGMIATDGRSADKLDPVVLADRVWMIVSDSSAAEVLMTPAGEVPTRRAGA